MAQDVGAHRKKMYAAIPNVEDELWRRAVWALVTMDRMVSFSLGRPCALHDEDFDLDLMLEVDEEYWHNSNPALAYKQPEGKPSKIAYANCMIRLQRIFAYASRTIYSINKSKQTLGYVGPEWEQRTVAELDSALNNWIDIVPEHLKWDPNRQDEIFLNQSCALYANYYLMQICIHRPFIQRKKGSQLPFPSLTICTNAARSAIHVMETQYHKSGKPLVMNRLPLFTSGLVLLLNVWGGKLSGLSNDTTMSDVHKCLQMLEHLEQHTFGARRLRGILSLLISIGEYPLPEGARAGNLNGTSVQGHEPYVQVHAPQQSPAGTRRNGASVYDYSRPLEASLPATSLYPTSALPATPNPIANNLTSSEAPSFDLPLRTEDLGRIPFHHGFTSPFTVEPVHRQPRFPSYVEPHPRTYYPNLDQHQPLATQTIPLPNTMGGVIQPMSNNGLGAPNTFEMSIAEYSRLLAAMSVSTPSPLETNEQQMYAQQSTAATGSIADADVSMIFEDNMADVWSSAPASLEWGDWDEYLNSISGMNNPFTGPPPGM